MKNPVELPCCVKLDQPAKEAVQELSLPANTQKITDILRPVEDSVMHVGYCSNDRKKLNPCNCSYSDTHLEIFVQNRHSKMST